MAAGYHGGYHGGWHGGGYGHGGHWHGGGWGPGVGLGILGLGALGAAGAYEYGYGPRYEYARAAPTTITWPDRASAIRIDISKQP
jgi:hypothetical protein